MKKFLKSLWILVGALAGVAAAWRLISRRQALPCPAWLGWLVENPLMESGAGRTLDKVDLHPGMRVLDYGSGPGRLTLPAAQRVGPGGEVTAFDMQPAMLSRVQERTSAAGIPNIRLLLGSAGSGSLEQDYYDRALLVTVLGEIPDRQEALDEIFAALKPGGLLSISELLPDPHFQPKATVRRLTTRAGFDELDCTGRPWSYTLLLRKPAAAAA
ncbi:MAG: class I SAM-dependent methyltransferase [Anaerolineaceae bacterium]|nr:class I SAM-dependent methyltransferase [Anaerolineaceae bacterium]